MPTNPPARLILIAGCMLHAVLVLALWAQTIIADRPLIPGKAWLALAWLWLVWPALLAAYSPRNLRNVVVPILVGALIIVPCIPTVYTFTIWAIGGFAP